MVTYKYTPDFFQEHAIIVKHMDLSFDVFDDIVHVDSHLHFQTKDVPVSSIALNAKNMEIHSISSPLSSVTFEYKKDEDKVFITFQEPLAPNTSTFLHATSSFKPTKNILEGLYYDHTPKDAPPQMITQCQQWGFQRLVPSVDEMNAKCTYSTTIIADKRYTHLLTNGDLSKGPLPVDENRVRVWYENTKTLMATYLFFLGVGTYDSFSREFRYPDGTTFQLELLAPPGTDETIAHHALDLLVDGVLYIHLFTGRDKYENEPIAKELYNLFYQRLEELNQGNDVSDIEEKLSSLAASKTWGYQYTGTVYREIGMENSNYGGMENVGNTTIHTNSLLPYNDVSDYALEYILRVKTHEFYHNLNGSEVTGWSPFEIWLNEAVTVFIEREHFGFRFGKDYARLNEVLTIISPANGVLQKDRGVFASPIIPEGFNSPDDLIDDVTYVKGPEFVRMLEQAMGKQSFVKGLAGYHKKFKHSNAKTSDWLDAMQEHTSIDVHAFAQKWLYESGHPVVSFAHGFDEKTHSYVCTFTQDGSWHFPCNITLCAEDGSPLATKEFLVTSQTHTVSFTDIKQPAFVSVNRDFAFFGTLKDESSTFDQLVLQAKCDQNYVARYFAFFQLFDQEMIRLLQDESAQLKPELLELMGYLLRDTKAQEDVSSLLLTRFPSVSDLSFRHDYVGLDNVRKRIGKAVAKRFEPLLRELVDTYAKPQPSSSFLEGYDIAIKRRKMHVLALSYLAHLDTPEIHTLLRETYENTQFASLRYAAISLYLDSCAPDKYEVYDHFVSYAKNSLRTWPSLLRITASIDNEDVFDLMRRLEESEHFRIESANDQRGLYLLFANNKKWSLLTSQGRSFLQERIQRLAPINDFNTAQLIEFAFSNIQHLKKESDTIACQELIKECRDHLKDVDAPMTLGSLDKLLESFS